jgi:hypothetical protein
MTQATAVNLDQPLCIAQISKVGAVRSIRRAESLGKYALGLRPVLRLTDIDQMIGRVSSGFTA